MKTLDVKGLQNPFTFTIPLLSIKDFDTNSSATLQCASFNEDLSQWEKLPTTVDYVRHIVMCESTHMS